jgi:hypothetical protein
MERKIFMAIYRDVSEEEANISPVAKIPKPTDLTPPFDPLEVEPMISLNALYNKLFMYL